ncbi:MAG: hypothetical protein M1546_24085 [Chloroflexi bacterium]|nr:hypothetical protein [Chloroflexota bacterium]
MNEQTLDTPIVNNLDNLATTPEFMIGQMRVQTASAFDYFYASKEITMDEIGKAFNELIPQIVAAQNAGKVITAGPVVALYLCTGETWQRFTLEVGFPVAAGTQPVDGVKVRKVSALRCASLLYWGDLAHLSKAYEALEAAMKQAGLKMGPDCREWYLHFENDQSPNNVILLQLGIQE